MIATGTLSRYIAKRFLRAIGSVFLLCIVLIFMIDFLELLRNAGKTGDVPVSAILVIGLLRIPSFAELTLPFAVLTGAIGAFLTLNRSSELVITRAGGMSVWQMLFPGLAVAVLLGIGTNMVYSPLAAIARTESERLFAKAYNEEVNLFRSGRTSQWLRQSGVDGSSVMEAGTSADQGMALSAVTVMQFDHTGSFVEAIDAKSAALRDGYWELSEAVVSRPGQRPESFGTYQVSTFLTPAEVKESLGSDLSFSYWQLPDMIALAEKAGLKATSLKVQYAMMQARPLLFAIMIVLAATVSLRTFRFGKIQTKVVVGLLGGFAFFILAEVSRQLGTAGLTSAWVSAWIPTAVAGFLSLTVLLHQEDG